MRKSDPPGKRPPKDAAKDDDAPPPRSGRKGPARLAIEVGAKARTVAAGRGFTLLSLASRWADIAGPALANHTQPMSLSAGGVLTLKADGGAALLVQHQSREILARVNALLGPEAAGSIKLVQGVVARGRSETPKPASPRLSPHEEAKVQDAVTKVSDPELRERLSGLMRRAIDAAKRR